MSNSFELFWVGDVDVWLYSDFFINNIVSIIKVTATIAIFFSKSDFAFVYLFSLFWYFLNCFFFYIVLLNKQ